MVFLDLVENGELVKMPCYPLKTNTVDKDVLLIVPTRDREVLFTVADKLKNGIGALKVRRLRTIFVPWRKKFKAGSQIVNYVNKDTNGFSKTAHDRGFPNSSGMSNKVKTFNCIIDDTHFLDKLYSMRYTKSNVWTFWDAFLDTWGLSHKKKYLFFSPDTTIVKINNLSTIKSTDFTPANLFINFLYMLKYNYDKVTGYMKERNIELLVTDGKQTFRFNWDENKLNKDDTLKLLFKNFRKMALGLAIDKSEEDEGVTDEINEVIEESVKPIDEKRLAKITKETPKEDIGKINSDKEPESIGIRVNDKDIIEESIDKVSDKVNGKEEVEDKLRNLEKEIDKGEDLVTSDKAIIEAQKVNEIVLNSTKTPERLDLRGHRLNTRQNTIKERNITEIAANIEELSEGITAKEVDVAGKFNRFKIADYDNQYQEQSKKDRLNIGESMASNSLPLYMTNYKEEIDEKSNDTYSKIVQYTFESPNSTKEKHTFSVRVPELREGRYLYVNGSDKVMVRQKLALPIIRLSDSVVFTTYYNKMFITHSSGNLSKKTAKIKKFITYIRKHISFNDLQKNFTFTPAYFTQVKLNHMSSELLEVSRFLSEIKIDNENYINLNMDSNVLAKLDGKTYYHNRTENTYYTDEEDNEYDILYLFTIAINIIGNRILSDYWNNQIVGKKASDNIMNPKIKILGKNMDLLIVILHAYDENLLDLLNFLRDEYDLEYSISTYDPDGTIPKGVYSDDVGDRFVFSNFILNVKYNNVWNRGLLDPLNKYDLTLYDSLKLTGITNENVESSNTVLYMQNFRDLFIDPITKEVMFDMGLPTDYKEALVYCNYLLYNYDRTVSDVSLKNERTPSNSEIIQGVLYKQVADAYSDYSIKKHRGSKSATFSVERDAVVKALVTLPNVEESSKINPVQNVDKTATISNKGVSGINNDRSYTPPKRAWDKSFYGVMSDVSPYTKGSGVSKHLAMNPNINNKRGYFDSKEPEDVEIDEIMSVSELLGPFAQRHDSTPRLAMGMMQFNHLIGTEGSDVALVSYGMDSALAHLDVDFAHSTRDDCEIIAVNDRFVKVRYSNLKDNKGNPLEQVYQINKIERNSAKAFYTPNNMELNPDIKFKVGTKVKKNTVLMYNKNVYQYHGGDIVFKSGPIVNVAIHHSQSSYEDAVLVTKALADKMKTKTTKRIAVKLNARNRIVNAISDLVQVTPGMEIFKYAEDTGSEMINANFDFSLLDDTLLKKKESHYNGVITDIYVYYKLSEDDKKHLNPTIKKFFKDIENLYDRKFNANSMKHNLTNVEINREIEHVTEFKGTKRNKVNGDNVDKGEILIEYYVEVDQPFTTGDKLTIGNTAMKGVCSKILDDKDAPYGLQTKRKVDLILSPISPLARMIYSTFITGYLSEGMRLMNEELKKIVNKK